MWRSSGLALHLAAPVARFARDDMVAPYVDPLQAFLDFVLVQYVQEGIGELDDAKLPDLLELKYHSLHAAAAKLGGAASIREAFVGFQAGLYRLP
jgi:type I restriction enzyme R subunit